MPINKDGACVCVNHPSKMMTPDTGHVALIGAEVGEETLVVDIEYGIPVVALWCKECGYVELYMSRIVERKK